MPTFGENIGMQAASGAIGTGMGLLLERHQDKRQLKQQGKLQALEITGQKEMSDYNYAKQLQMWEDTNYSAQMEQLKKAGLNPGLLYGMGGAGGATTGQPVGNVTGGHAPSESQVAGMGMTMMQMGLLKAQKENIEADTENKKADIPVKTATVPKIEAETASLTQGIENQKAQETLTRVDTELRQVQASIARQTINDAMQTIENQAKKSTEELTALKLENALSATQFDDKVKALKAHIGRIAVENALTRAQTQNVQQDTKNKIQEIKESEQRIQSMVQSLMIAWDKLSLETTQSRINWQDHLTRENDDFKFLKDLIPGMLIPIGKGFGGGTHKPVTGFR